ncbi:MAG: hypothetical protein OHK0039_05430 [Bacteroidia bacterium]
MLRGLIVLGLIMTFNLLFWFFKPEHIGFLPLYLLLNVSFAFKLLRIFHEWYHYFGLSVPTAPPVTRTWTVDMLTTYCAGEPYDMIERTLEAMVAVTYPHENYLCDEANDPYLREVCARLGVHHVYRGTNKVDAKAGNINFALERYARGEIAIILDPDHIPVPEFIDRVIPYFENDEVGYVQCVQAYYNRNESFVAKGAAEQTYQFYGPMMMSMHTYGTAQAIGANCAFRRTALDDIGGHAPGLAEDMHTAMQIHAKGWKSVYVPEALTRGLVPATLSAYYKQQLKWSRGVFELLFFVYPKLFRHFTFRQKLHYGLLPFHFLGGFITLIDIVVPIAALFMARVPWHVDLVEFVQYLLPLVFITMLIRQISQRWVLEEHERGFHFIGGTLLAGSWWVLIIGFVYTLLRIKVPYIPTPKEGDEQNEWQISLPNIGVILLSLAAMAYGLYIDWQPYSMVMASFAFTNVVVLGFVVIMGQRKLFSRPYKGLYGRRFRPVRVSWYRFRHRLVYPLMRSGYIVSAVAVVMLMLSFSFFSLRPTINLSRLAYNAIIPYDEGFYLGVDGTLGALTDYQQLEAATGLSFHIVPVPWTDDVLPYETLQALGKTGKTPLLYWDPAVLPPDSGARQSYLREMALAIREIQYPIFLQPGPAWQGAGADKRLAVWHEMHRTFGEMAAANVAWVWPVADVEALAAFPGKEYVDWVAVAPETTDGDPAAWYAAFHPQLAALGLPVRLDMAIDETLTREACATALRVLERDYVEVQGLMLHVDQPQARTALARQPALLACKEIFGTAQRRLPDLLPTTVADAAVSALRVSDEEIPAPGSLRHEDGRHELVIDGAPFYIRGMVYHPSPHWYEGNSPLTRRQLENDFRRMKKMGVNTIRRYGSDVYDVNVLRVANEQEMKVLFGFELNPHTDYLRNRKQLDMLARDILRLVHRHKHNPSILGWTLGNETWDRLRYKYRQPYLTQVRIAYLAFVEELAARIHEADPSRPVFTALESTPSLAADLYAHRVLAPSVDVVGINALYTSNLAAVDSLARTWYPDRPYVITEFGPDGYWDAPHTRRDAAGYVDEPSSYEKAIAYAERWKRHIAPHRGHNLGGFAYSWRDQHEGTSTWYGITDMKSRLKPAYYALRQTWAQDTLQPPLADAYISPPDPYWYRQDKLEFLGVSENNRRTNLHYDWLLSEERIDGPEQARYKVGSGNRVFVELPDPQRRYRIYLYISDDEGHVVTASRIANP